MKLKLQEQEGVKVLSITPPVQASDLPILRAGVQKMVLSGTQMLVLDFTEVKETNPPTLVNEFPTLVVSALEKGALAVLVSENVHIANAPSLKEGVAIIKGPLGKLIARETQLKASLAVLTARKEQLEKNMGAATEAANQLKTAKSENSEYARRVRSLEKIVRGMFKKIQEPAKSDLYQSKNKTLHETLDSILGKDLFK